MNFVLIAVFSLCMLKDVPCVLAAVIRFVTAQCAMERRLKMYSPSLSDKAVRTIYRIKRCFKKPMTEIAESFIKESLKTLDKNKVCELCTGEGNNQCNECYLNERR